LQRPKGILAKCKVCRLLVEHNGRKDEFFKFCPRYKFQPVIVLSEVRDCCGLPKLS
jgi:hypothetical protein